MTTKHVALIRVSTDRQDVDVQRRDIDRWAAANRVEIATWYEEPATCSAATRRPELDRLLADARRGRIGTVVVVALDRLGRSAIRVINNLHELDAAGVRVVSLREALDFGTPAGRLVASVMAHVAEIERESLRERTRAGLRAARAKGKRLGRPALQWTPDDVANVRRLVAAGESVEGIARKGLVQVFRRTKDGDEIPVKPSASAIRRALREAAP